MLWMWWRVLQSADVLGVLTFVGRVERDYSTLQKRFFEFRWVHLADESTRSVFAIKLFPNSNEATFQRSSALLCCAQRVLPCAVH